ncbi:DUF4116 domain-containing protein, partial [Mycoplasma sp. CB776]
MDNIDFTQEKQRLKEFGLKLENEGALTDEEFVFNVLTNEKIGYSEKGLYFSFLSDKAKENKNFINKLIKKTKNFWFLFYASNKLKNDEEFVLDLVKSSYEYNSNYFKNQKEVILKAVKEKSGYLLQFILGDLKNNKEVSRNLKYASYNLKNDKKFVLEVVKQIGYALKYASEELKND